MATVDTIALGAASLTSAADHRGVAKSVAVIAVMSVVAGVMALNRVVMTGVAITRDMTVISTRSRTPSALVTVRSELTAA